VPTGGQLPTVRLLAACRRSCLVRHCIADPVQCGTVASMTSRRAFTHRSETFGFDTAHPWAYPAVRLLMVTPRAYQPLVDAWERRYPGTRKALSRLVDLGFVDHQPRLVINTRTGAVADREAPAVDRFRLSARGRRLKADVDDDLRALEDHFTNLTEANVKNVARLLAAFDLDGSHAKYGRSAASAVAETRFSDRSGRWWVRRLCATGHLTELDFRLADTREVVPAHWRTTRRLCRQLREVLEVFSDEAAATSAAWRLGRTRFLDDLDPARVGVSGATDFDHDVDTQRVLADLLRSPAALTDHRFVVEPRLQAAADTASAPWTFTPSGADTVFYQPDAELLERRGGHIWRTVVEYERYQTRRDAWSHIERLLGDLATRSLPFESAVLRFALDGESRVRSYVKLIEGFAAYSLDHPQVMPPNRVLLMVSSAQRLARAADPLADAVWYRIPVATPAVVGLPRLHPPKRSPYDDYVL
jgi:hypothetical protein